MQQGPGPRGGPFIAPPHQMNPLTRPKWQQYQPSVGGRGMQARAMPQQPMTGPRAVQGQQMIGEKLFPMVQDYQPHLAGKITGMLLEIDNSELLHMLDSPQLLKDKVEEAVQVLTAHQAKEAAAKAVQGMEQQKM